MKYADSDNAQLCLGFSNRKLSTASKNVVNNPVPLTLKYIKHH